MKSRIIVTEDNSKTLLIPELNETYHSTKGAITEALHVFIKNGFNIKDAKELKILEMGFGSGLNAIISLNEAEKRNQKVIYHTIEQFPIEYNKALELGYLELLGIDHLKDQYEIMHTSSSEENVALHDNFTFFKILDDVRKYAFKKDFYDLIYYDAFGPKVQPELWDESSLQKMFDALVHGGTLVTYCAQGQFKRNLKVVGFKVESLEGPPGKREMTRATKQ